MCYKIKSFIFLRHHSIQIVPPLSMKGINHRVYFEHLSLSLSLIFNFSISFANRLPLFFIPLVQSFDHYPLSKKEKKEKKKKNWKADDDQGQSGDKAIGIIAKHYRLSFDRFYGWRDSKRHTIVLCFAHVQIEFPSNSTYTVSKKKVIGDSLISRYYSIFIRNKDLSLCGSRRLG